MRVDSLNSIESFPRRIQLYIPQLSGGGSERQISRLANALASRFEEERGSHADWAIELVTWTPPTSDRYPLHRSISRVGLALETKGGGIVQGVMANWRRIQAIRRQHARFQPDAVISFCDTMNILVLLAVANRSPVLISERNDPRRQVLSRSWEWMRRRSYHTARACVAQTEEVSEYLRTTYFSRAPERVLTIPSAIEAPECDLDVLNQARRQNNPLVCLFLGRFSTQKRVDRLLEAWAELHLNHPQWRLRLVGEGAEEDRLRALADKLGIQQGVEWSPWTTDVWKEWRSANIYALSSDFEGFPQSMLEAMTAGLPCVVTDSTPAIGELFGQRNIGQVVNREATGGDFAQALNPLMSSLSLREDLGGNAASVAANYQWNAVADRWFRAIHFASTGQNSKISP